MLYGLTKEEAEELKQLSKELFKGATFVVFDEDHDQEKICRYNYLVRKKQELMRATMN